MYVEWASLDYFPEADGVHSFDTKKSFPECRIPSLTYFSSKGQKMRDRCLIAVRSLQLTRAALPTTYSAFEVPSSLYFLLHHYGSYQFLYTNVYQKLVLSNLCLSSSHKYPLTFSISFMVLAFTFRSLIYCSFSQFCFVKI